MHKEYEKIKSAIFNPSAEIAELHSKYEAFCSASFNVFLPNMDYKEHNQGFKEVLFNPTKAKFERINMNLIDKLDLSEFNLIEDSGSIISAFHYGSYQMISSALIKMNKKFFIAINVTLEVRTEVINESEKYFKLCKKRYNNTVQDNIIHLCVQNESFVIDAKNYIEQGYIMVMFIDGNSGSDGVMKFKSKNVTRIKFLNQYVSVKQGLPAMAYICNVPICPVFAERTNDPSVIKIKSYPPIIPNLEIPRNIFSTQATQQIYSILDQKLLKQPFEWDGWLYVHRWLERENLDPKIKMNINDVKKEDLKFNKKKFFLFKERGLYFLLNKDTHLSYELSEETKKMITGTINALNEDELNYLKSKEIFI